MTLLIAARAGGVDGVNRGCWGVVKDVWRWAPFFRLHMMGLHGGFYLDCNLNKVSILVG